VSAPTCELCGQRVASYVCQSCGRAVCDNCFSSPEWSCTACLGRTRATDSESEPMPLQLSWLSLLFLVAFAAIFVGILLMSLGSLSNLSGASSGAIILLGPIPIVLGNGPYSLPLIVLAAGLTVFAVVFFLVLRRRRW
jgi:uncharacterized membrane protein